MFRSLLQIYPAYTLLKIKVTGDHNLKELYKNKIENHNNKIFNNPHCIDAGFDLYSPDIQIMCDNCEVNKVDYKIQCMAIMETPDKSFNTGFYLYPRSSIIKTPLRLANSVGIIDAGYRGNIIGVFDCLTSEANIMQYDRLVQICAPSLMPLVVEMVDELDASERGSGGFGSTGSSA